MSALISRIPLLVVTGLLSSGLGVTACVPATNQFDPNTPADQQVKGIITGRAAFPNEGDVEHPPEGILVELFDESDTVVDSTITSATDDGQFRFNDVLPGSLRVVASSMGYESAIAGPFELFAGETRNLFTLQLFSAPATSSLSGSVNTVAPVPPAGVVVDLVRLNGDTCLFSQNTTQTDANGEFFFDAVRPGRYRVTAWSEGATLAVSAAIDIGDDEDVELSAALSLSGINSSIQLSGVPQGDFTTSTPQINVSLDETFAATEMRFGFDATFSPIYGGTGWQTFANTTQLDVPGDEGVITVFFQLKDDCVQTPVYASKIIYDATPALFLQARIEGFDGVAQAAIPKVVIGDTRTNLDVNLTVQDLSGVTGVQFLNDGDLPDLTPFVPVGPTASNQAAVIRVSAPLPAGQGRHTLRIRLQDRAGNITPVDDAVVFTIIRDLSPPTIPIASVEEMEVSANFAYVWLDERPCPAGEDSNPYICDGNPPARFDEKGEVVDYVPLFRIRGAPGYPDFRSIPGPPFRVPLFSNGDTVIEIQAVDDAGNVSAGNARVRISHKPGKVIFTSSADKSLGLHRRFSGIPSDTSTSMQASLVASGGTAFFALAPRGGVEAPTYYPYLVAQPIHGPKVAIPDAHKLEILSEAQVLKLAINTDSFYSDDYPYQIFASGLTGKEGKLSWLKSDGRLATQYRSSLQADGTFDIFEDYGRNSGNYFEDEDGDNYQEKTILSRCRERGLIECIDVPNLWSATQKPTTSSHASHQFAAYNAISEINASFEGTSAGYYDVIGPKIIGIQLTRKVGSSSWMPQRMSFDVENSIQSYLLTYRAEINGSEIDFSTSRISGGDVVILPDGESKLEMNTNVTFSTGGDELFAIYVPEGSSMRLPLINPENADFLGFESVRTLIRDASFGSSDDDPSDRTSLSATEDLPGTLPLNLTFSLPNFYGFSGENAPAKAQSGLSLVSLSPKGKRDATTYSLESYQEGKHSVGFKTKKTTIESSFSSFSAYSVAANPTFSEESRFCSVLFTVEEPTEISSLELMGQGPYLDSAFGRLWEKEGDGIFGRFSPSTASSAGFEFYANSENPTFNFGSDCDAVQNELLGEQSSEVTVTPFIKTESFTTYLPTPQAHIEELASVLDVSIAGGELYTFIEALPVTRGSKVYFESTGTGDIDISVRFSETAGFEDYSYSVLCNPYASGSNEKCGRNPNDAGDSSNEIVIEDIGFVQLVAYGYAAGTGSFESTISVYPALGEYTLLETTNVNAGDHIELSFDYFSGDGNHRFIVGLGREPTIDDNDCSASLYSFSNTCSLDIPQGISQVFISALEDYAVTGEEYRITRTMIDGEANKTVSQLDAYSDVGSFFTIEGAVDEGLEIVVVNDTGKLFDDSSSLCDLGENKPNCSCEMEGQNYSCNGSFYGEDSDIFVAFRGSDIAGGTATATLTHYSVGCDSVRTDNIEATLQPGYTYGLTVSGGYEPYRILSKIGGNEVRGTTSMPTFVNEGSSVNSAGPLSILGAIAAASIDQDGNLVVPGIEAANICDIKLKIPVAPKISDIIVNNDEVYYLEEVTDQINDEPLKYTKLKMTRVDDNLDVVAEEEVQLPSERTFLSLSLLESGVVVLDSEEDGRNLIARSIDMELDTSCILADFDEDDLFYSTSQSSNGNRIVVGGIGVLNPEVRIYEIKPRQVPSQTSNRCETMEAVLIERFPTANVPKAVAFDQFDLFVWSEASDDTGELTYFPLRSILPLFEGGRSVVEGFDVRGGETLFTKTDLASSATTIVHLKGNPIIGKSIKPSGRWLHSFLMDDNLLASFTVVQGQGQVSLLNLESEEQSMISLSASVFEGQPEGAIREPIVWARVPTLTVNNNVIVMVGLDSNGAQQLAAVELDSPNINATQTTVLDVTTLPSKAEQVFASDNTIVVTFTNGQSWAYARASGEPYHRVYMPDEDKPPAEKTFRLIGTTNGRFVLFRNPGSLLEYMPPNETEVVVVTEAQVELLQTYIEESDAGVVFDGGLDLADAGQLDGGDLLEEPVSGFGNAAVAPELMMGWVPSELYTHSFGTVATGKNGDLFLYDLRSEEAILWRVIAESGNTTVDDGALRPLTQGVEGLGILAYPKVDGERIVVIRGTQSGRQLLELGPLQ